MTEKSEAEATATKAPDTAADAEGDALWQEMTKQYDDRETGVTRASDVEDQVQKGKDDFKAADEKAAKNKDDAADKTAKPSKDGKAADAKTDKDADKTDGAASKDAATAKVDDLWKGAEIDPKTNLPRNPKVAELKKAYDEAPESARPAIEAIQREYLERGQEIARLRTTVSQSRRPAAAAEAPAKKAVVAKDVTKDTKFAKAHEEFKDVLDPVAEQLNDANSRLAKMEERLNGIEPEVVKAKTATERAGQKEQESLFLQQHSDYMTVRTTAGFENAFAGWLEGQPDAIRQMAANNTAERGIVDAAEASTLFTLFKAQTGFGANAVTGSNTKADDKSAAGEGAKTETKPSQSDKRALQLAGSSEVSNRGAGGQVAADKNDDDFWYKKWADRYKDVDERTYH